MQTPPHTHLVATRLVQLIEGEIRRVHQAHLKRHIGARRTPQVVALRRLLGGQTKHHALPSRVRAPPLHGAVADHLTPAGAVQDALAGPRAPPIRHLKCGAEGTALDGRPEEPAGGDGCLGLALELRPQGINIVGALRERLRALLLRRAQLAIGSPAGSARIAAAPKDKCFGMRSEPSGLSSRSQIASSSRWPTPLKPTYVPAGTHPCISSHAALTAWCSLQRLQPVILTSVGQSSTK